MKKIYKNAALFLLFVPLLSCNEQEDVSPQSDFSNSKKQISINSTKGKDIKQIKYIYKGELSTIEYKTDGKSNLLLEGKDNKKIETAFKLPTLVTYIEASDTSTIYLFDTYQEYDAAVNKGKYLLKEKEQFDIIQGGKSNKLTSSSVSLATTASYTTPPRLPTPGVMTHIVQVFQDKNYNNLNFTIPNLILNYDSGIAGYHYLFNINWSTITSVDGSDWQDRISSFYIDNRCDGCNSTNAIRLELYQHANYDGKALVYSVMPGFEGGIPDLSAVKMGGIFSGNWNEEASSLKVLHYYAY